MHRRNGSARALKTRFLVPFAALSFFAFVAACGGAPTLGQTASAPTTGDLPALMVTACLDRTPSYDRSYFDAGKNMLADAIVQRASSGQLGATIYVTLIGHNSYATSATVRTIILPATPHNFASASTTPDTNTFNDPTATAEARAAATATAVVSQSARLAQQLQPDITFLRDLNPPTDSPTDILGCVSRAAERFKLAPAATQKVLILVTDLQEAGPQQDDQSRPLNGVFVKVIDWKCDDAQTCGTLKSQWQNEFVTKDQAASATYYDPSETQADLPGHLFDVNL